MGLRFRVPQQLHQCLKSSSGFTASVALAHEPTGLVHDYDAALLAAIASQDVIAAEARHTDVMNTPRASSCGAWSFKFVRTV